MKKESLVVPQKVKCRLLTILPNISTPSSVENTQIDVCDNTCIMCRSTIQDSCREEMAQCSSASNESDVGYTCSGILISTKEQSIHVLQC